MHRRLAGRARTVPHRVAFVGDSLTAYWLETGRLAWGRTFAPLPAEAFGIPGDTIANLRWRLQNGELEGKGARLYVVLIGTNDLGQPVPPEPEWIVDGVRKVVDDIRERRPEARILVQSIPPGGADPRWEHRKRIVRVNSMLAATDWPRGVSFVDTHDRFLDEDGWQRRELFLDAIHFSAEGYRMLAEALKPEIDRILDETEGKGR